MTIAAASQISPGDTAWMLIATALVLMMTPALGLFYAGLVRSKNALNTFMMSAGALGVATIAFAVVGYSLAFGHGDGFVGGLSFVFLGAGLLWFGWFGFNGGSGYTVGNPGVLAFTNTLLAPARTLVVWFVLDLIRGGKVTAIGAATAIIVGCVGITPAAGYISPRWAMALGALAALPSYALIMWRPRTRLDETLDVLGAHGLAGFIGLAMPLRAAPREQALGMDVIEHGEQAYTDGEGAILLSYEEGEADGRNAGAVVARS